MPTISTVCGAWGRRDVELTEEELEEIDVKAYDEHRAIMRVCIDDAEKLYPKSSGIGVAGHIVSALFAMRARPIHYIREEAAKEKWLKEHPAKKPICASPKDDVKKDLSLL